MSSKASCCPVCAQKLLQARSNRQLEVGLVAAFWRSVVGARPPVVVFGSEPRSVRGLHVPGPQGPDDLYGLRPLLPDARGFGLAGGGVVGLAKLRCNGVGGDHSIVRPAEGAGAVGLPGDPLPCRCGGGGVACAPKALCLRHPAAPDPVLSCSVPRASRPFF